MTFVKRSSKQRFHPEVLGILSKPCFEKGPWISGLTQHGHGRRGWESQPHLQPRKGIPEVALLLRGELVTVTRWYLSEDTSEDTLWHFRRVVLAGNLPPSSPYMCQQCDKRSS